MTNREEVKQYIEEIVKTGMSVYDSLYDDYNHGVDVIRKALEKQIKKKPDYNDFKNRYFCHCCGEQLAFGFDYQVYCDKCGQRIDWSDEE